MKEGKLREQIVRTKRFDEGDVKEARGRLIGSDEDAKILHHIGDGCDRRQKLVLQIATLEEKSQNPRLHVETGFGRVEKMAIAHNQRDDHRQ